MTYLKHYGLFLGLLLLALAGCNQNPSGTGNSLPVTITKPAQPVPAFVRTLNGARGVGPLALDVDGKKVTADLKFGEASNFLAVQQLITKEPHHLSAIDESGKTVAGPLILDLSRGEDITLVIGGTKGKLVLTPFEHTNRGAAPGQAKVAVLHADPTLPALQVAVDGKNWTGDLDFGEVSGYHHLAPGAHSLTVSYDKTKTLAKVKLPSAKSPIAVKESNFVMLTQPLDVQADKVYSVVAYADAAGLPALHLLEDKFTPDLVRAPETGPAPPENVK